MRKPVIYQLNQASQKLRWGDVDRSVRALAERINGGLDGSAFNSVFPASNTYGTTGPDAPFRFESGLGGVTESLYVVGLAFREPYCILPVSGHSNTAKYVPLLAPGALNLLLDAGVPAYVRRVSVAARRGTGAIGNLLFEFYNGVTPQITALTIPRDAAPGADGLYHVGSYLGTPANGNVVGANGGVICIGSSSGDATDLESFVCAAEIAVLPSAIL